MMKYRRNKGLLRVLVLILSILIVMSISGVPAFAEEAVPDTYKTVSEEDLTDESSDEGQEVSNEGPSDEGQEVSDKGPSGAEQEVSEEGAYESEQEVSDEEPYEAEQESSDEELYEAEPESTDGKLSDEEQEVSEDDLIEAEEEDPETELEADAEYEVEDDSQDLLSYDLPSGISYVWFGGKIWQVIDNSDKTIANDETGKRGILLISEHVLGSIRQWNSHPFAGSDTSKYRWRYDNSEIRYWLQHGFEDTLDMSTTEQSAVLTAVKDDIKGAFTEAYEYKACGLSGDRFFLPSVLEVNKAYPYAELRRATNEQGQKATWWTRCSDPSLDGSVLYTHYMYGWQEDGISIDLYTGFCDKYEGVRPMFYLDPDMIESVSTGFEGIKILHFTDGTSSTGEFGISVSTEGGGYTVNVTSALAGTEVQLKATSENGYRFKKWEVLSGGAVIADPTSDTTIFTMPRQDVEIKAVFEPVIYSITYKLNGGTANSANPTSYTIESDNITLAGATKPGRVFDGWYDQDGWPVTTIPKGTTGDITLRANWTIESDTEARAVNCGPEILGSNVNCSEHVQTVSYANRQWYVISYEDAGDDALAREGAVTLFQKYLSSDKTSKYSQEPQNQQIVFYSVSDLRNAVESFLDDFTAGEEAALFYRTLPGDSGYYGADLYDPNGVAGPDVTTNIWPLSVAEADALNRALRISGDGWKLRTPGSDYNRIARVDPNTFNVNRAGGWAIVSEDVRPAFYLDLNSIQFVTAREEADSFDSTESLRLQPVGVGTTDEWKVTLKDDGSVDGLNGHQDFSIEPHIFFNDDGRKLLSVSYNGAAAGENEYISAVIIDNAGTVKYYGRIVNCTSSFGNVRIVLDGELSDGDKLYLFNEQYNTGDYASLSSALKEVEVPSAYYLRNIGGSGTEEEPYIISSESDWNNLASFTATGSNISGMYFRLDNDISVSKMVGTSEKPYNGYFDGNGHTLTFNAPDAKDACAPFCYVGSAEFMDLTVKGSISTSARLAAGLVSTVSTSCRITNCVSDIDISSSIDGYGTHGGFVSTGKSVTYENCVFTGSIIGEKTTHCGAFQGWDKGGSTCTACLSDTSDIVTASNTSTFIRNANGTDLTTNCYYTRAISQGYNNGKPAHTVTAGEGISLGLTGTRGVLWNGKIYAAKNETISFKLPEPKIISDRYEASAGTFTGSGTDYQIVMPDEDVVLSYKYDLADAKVVLSKTEFTYNMKVQKPTVKTIRGMTLKEGTDYTAAWSNASSKDKGTYTVTIEGLGSCFGTATATYKIKAKAVTPKVTLSKTVYTYNGTKKTPGVTVKDGSTVLKKGTDYTVTYDTGRKNVGTYKVAVKLTGNYSGKKVVSFKINPKGTSLVSLTAGTKKMTVKWNKQATQTTGYQIQYSRSSTFATGNKTVKVTSRKSTSKSIKELKTGKKYYVRIRTYKTVDGKNYYSGWSKKKSVTIK